jgi:acetolactate synthase-1/2/3 large subunit
MAQLGEAAPANTSFVTDMGTALISGFQVLEPRGGQRLFTSQGLGEMGYGLPGAIGAWFADPSREVICLNCDGGLMMNLQDLHSVISHGIPMKIVIFNNDGYLMIKHTQNAIVGGRRAGTDAGSGLSCPNYEPLVKAFGFAYHTLKKEDDSKQVIRTFLAQEQPTVLEVFMAPDQLLVPKLSVSITAEGKLVSPPLEDLSPLISMEQLEQLLLVPVHASSMALNRKVTEAKGDAIY